MLTNLVIKKCLLCNIEFSLPNNNKSIKRLFCSRSCSSSFNGSKNRGLKRSDEFKKQCSIRTSGSNNPFFGKKHSDTTKQILSVNHKWEESDFNYANLNSQQFDIIDGLMLGDGHLNKSIHSARLTHGTSEIEILELMKSSFPQLRFSNIWQSKKNFNYHFKSGFYKDLLSQQERWYPNKKRVPLDVIISDISCFWWFIGDGTRGGNSVILCTDDFYESEVEYLCNKFREKHFICWTIYDKSYNRYRIRFKTTSSRDFLNWILTNNQIPKCYEYKWR